MIGIIILICFILALSSIPVCVVLGIREDRKKAKEENIKNEYWLAEEMTKPRYRVVVSTLDGTIFRGKPLEPKIREEYKYSTSQDRAKRLADYIAKGSSFNVDEYFVPHHQIDWIKIERVINEST